MDHLISSAADCVSHQQLMTWLAFATKTKRLSGGLSGICEEMQQETVFFFFFFATVRRWKWEFQLTKVNFGVLRSESVKRSPLWASMRQLLTSELISKALWVGETACPGICGRKKKKRKSPILLSRSLSVSSLCLWELTEVSTVAVNSLRRPAGRQGSAAMGRPFCTSRTPSVCRIACQKY